MSQPGQQPLWIPSPERVATTQLKAFMDGLATTEDFDARGDYFALHRWSLEQPEAFWRAVWRFTEVQGTPGDTVCDDPPRLPGCATACPATACPATPPARHVWAATRPAWRHVEVAGLLSAS